MDNSPSESWPKIVIVGAGISGICAAIKLKEAGFNNIAILEKSADIGGTWRDNIYPGAACDIPSQLYSLSFAPENWPRKYAKQPDILEYLCKLVKKYNINYFIKTKADVTGAIYNKKQNKWKLDIANLESIHADILILACGQLTQPNIPDIPGREIFSGAVFHSADWDKNFDPSGKSVAIVGNAASAVQISAAIASKVRHLTIYQRSPNWIAPLIDRGYSKFEIGAMAHVPGLRRLSRWLTYLRHEATIFVFRRNSLSGRLFTFALTRFMKAKISDNALNSELIPDYEIGCKRILLSNGFLKLFRKDEVSLVTRPISKFTRHHIVTDDSVARTSDAVVFATGFRTQKPLEFLKVRGQNGQYLSDYWKDGVKSYLGLTIPGFPNMFMLYGPNTGLGHNSVILMIEQQVNYVKRLLKAMKKSGLTSVNVREDIVENFSKDIQDQMSGSSWMGNCTNWYRSDNGQVIANWPYSTIRYWWLTRKPNLSDYATK